MMKAASDMTRYKRVAIAAVLLAVLYIALVTVAPGMKMWGSGTDNVLDRYEATADGEEYSVTFVMPYDKLTRVEIDLKDVEETEKIVKIDADLLLTDDDGEVVCSQHIDSVFEDHIDLSGKRVDEDGRYTLTLKINSTGDSGKDISLGFNSDDRMYIRIEGLHTGVDSKVSFGILYLIISALVLLYVANIGQGDDKGRTITDKTLFYAAIIMAVMLVNQPFDLFMIAKGGLRLTDAVKSGHILDFYDYVYDRELVSGSERMYFSYNYSVFAYLPISILLLPFSFVADGDLERGTLANSIILYLDAMIAVATVLSLKLLDRTVRECGMSDEYKKSVRNMFAFSSVLIYITVAFGQIDIFYILIMLLALPYYYRGRYKTFSLIMAFAVVFKLLPIMVFIPMILLVNKKLKDITLNTAICVSVTLLSKIIFERGQGYDMITGMIDDSYSFADRLFEANIGGNLSLFVISYAIVCLICYMNRTDASDKKEFLYRSMLVMFTTYGLFMIFVAWHIQWMIPLILSLAFLFPFVRNDNRLLVADIAMEALIMLVIFYKEDTVYLLDYGSLAVSDYDYSGPSVKAVLEGISPLLLPLFSSLLASLVIFFIGYFALDARKRSKTKETVLTDHAMDRSFVTGRIFIFFGTMILYTWCYYFIG